MSPNYSQEIKINQFVGVVLVRKDGQVLVQLRDDNPKINAPNTISVTGGRRELEDLDLKNAGARELFEETGYIADLNDLKILTSDNYYHEDGRMIERIIFWAPYDEVQEINCYEGQRMFWVSVEEFNELKIYNGHKAFFEQAAKMVR